MIKALLLDVDGVLVDSDEAIGRMFAHLLNKYDVPVPSREEILSHMGEPFLEWCRHLLPAETRSDDSFVAQMADYGLQRYEQFYFPILGKEMPQASKTLKELKKKYKIAIITNNEARTWQRHEKFFKWQGLYDVVVCHGDAPRGKPFADPALKALELLGAAKESALLVGDTRVDVECAKAAGVKSVLVTAPRNEKLESDFRISSFSELPALLKRISKKK